MKIKKAVLLPDIHFPYHDKDCIKLVKKFIKDFKPDELIYMGDQMDFDYISKFNKDKLKNLEGKRFSEDYEGFQKEILTPIEKAAGKKCKKVYIIGNHSQRVEKIIEKEPLFSGIIDIEKNLDLSDYTIIPFGGVYRLGKLRVIHGKYTNDHHAKKTVIDFEKSVVYGHLHSIQTYTKTRAETSSDFHMGRSIGCLCNVNPKYMRNKGHDWVHGFGIVYVRPNGDYDLYDIEIIKNKFVYGGKLYKV